MSARFNVVPSFGLFGSADTGVLSIVNNGFPTIKVGEPVTLPLQSSNAVTPVVWGFFGSLPTGLTLAGSNIVGTPTTAGGFDFVLSVQDATGKSVQKSLSIGVIANAPVTTTTPPPATTPATTPATEDDETSVIDTISEYKWYIIGGATAIGIFAILKN